MSQSKGKNTIIILLLLQSFFVHSQVNRYMVFFADKQNSAFSIDNPAAFLSTRSIERKQKFNIDITEQDLPVKQAYVDGITTSGATVFFTSRWLNAALVELDVQNLSSISELPFVTGVEYIAKDSLKSARKYNYTIPEEFMEPNIIATNGQLQATMIDVPAMHEAGFTGEGMLIAVFDAGFTGSHLFKTMSHIFTQNKLIGARDFVHNSINPFDYNSHGTSVLSTIASNYGGFTGSAPDASFILCITEDVSSEFRIEEYNWVIAAEYADSLGADIIHSSLGYYDFNDNSMDYTYAQMNGETAVITKAANVAMEKGILVVTSAGNEGNSSWKYITAPADSPDILAVGSVSSNYLKSGFSSVGPTSDGRVKPDVMALGTSTVVMNGAGSIITGNGTSYAAPQVAGLAAGIWQANPDWTNYQLANRIRTTASRALNPDSLYGYGIPGYTSAIEGRVLAIKQVLADQVKVFPNPFQDQNLFIDIREVVESLPITISIYDTEGKKIIEQVIRTDSVTDQPIEMKVPATKPGIYFMHLQSFNFSKRIKLIHY